MLEDGQTIGDNSDIHSANESQRKMSFYMDSMPANSMFKKQIAATS